MNFGLVVPKYVDKGKVYDFYLGLAIISSCLKQKGYNVFCLNTNHYDDSIEFQLLKFITFNKIDVICTGGMSIHYAEINKVLEVTKSINPNIITIVGGAIITSNPKVICWGIKHIDYGIIGEGEETIIELADALINNKAIHNIKGLSYFNKNNEYILTEDRIPISNLDIIPMPDYEGFEYDKFMKLFYPSESKLFSVLDEVRVGYIMASRSCPFACTFCFHHHLSKYRQRSLDNVFNEIDFLVNRYNINFLNVTDELFSFDKKRMYEFAARIKPYNIKWWTNFRVSDVDKESLDALRDSGAFMISYGIESISDTILKSMKKHITKSQIENALKLTYEAKLNIQGNIILGDIEETEETAKESIDWLNSHPEYGVNLVMIRTFPFSTIYKHAISKGLIKDEFAHMKNKFPLINLTKMSDKKYLELCVYVENHNSELQNSLDAKVISTKITSKTEYGENIYSMSVECPLCNNIIQYNNMVQKTFKTNFVNICRVCHGNIRIENIKAYTNNYNFHDKFMMYIVKYVRDNVNKHWYVNKFYSIAKKLKNNNLIKVSDKYI